jgi:hypothetical protein
MKKCSKCKEDKELNEFGVNNYNLKDGKSSYCKKCMRDTVKIDYNNNKKKYNNRNKLYKRNQTEWYKEYKATLSCSKCGFQHPAVIDFHHKDPKQKDFTIGSELYNGKSVEEIKKEIDKCDILCANCHRILHWEENEKKFQDLLKNM